MESIILLTILYFLLDTWRKDVNCHDIKNAINDAAPGKMRAVSVSKVGF